MKEINTCINQLVKTNKTCHENIQQVISKICHVMSLHFMREFTSGKQLAKNFFTATYTLKMTCVCK
jgi:hypothetical protein